MPELPHSSKGHVKVWPIQSIWWLRKLQNLNLSGQFWQPNSISPNRFITTRWGCEAGAKAVRQLGHLLFSFVHYKIQLSQFNLEHVPHSTILGLTTLWHIEQMKSRINSLLIACSGKISFLCTLSLACLWSRCNSYWEILKDETTRFFFYSTISFFKIFK